MPGLNPLKTRECFDKPVSTAENGGPADAVKYQITPIAEPAKAGPT
jgi:hypothetical protein